MIDLIMLHFTPFQLGLMSFPFMLVLIALRVPLAAAMFVTGLLGTFLVAGNMRLVDSQLKTFAYGTLTNYSLSIIPMFLLMNEFAGRGGMSSSLFKAAEAWLGHRRGGLAMAAIGASAGFGAVCCSSLATASSMGRVAAGAAPRGLQRCFVHGCTGCRWSARHSRMLGYMLTVAIYARLVPGSGDAQPRLPDGQRFLVLLRLWPVALIFTFVIGGIYSGVFSPTAAAGVGVAGTALVVISKGNPPLSSLKASLLSTAQTSAMIFFIILAAGVYNSFFVLRSDSADLGRILPQLRY